jgi:hypothetical protein
VGVLEGVLPRYATIRPTKNGLGHVVWSAHGSVASLRSQLIVLCAGVAAEHVICGTPYDFWEYESSSLSYPTDMEIACSLVTEDEVPLIDAAGEAAIAAVRCYQSDVKCVAQMLLDRVTLREPTLRRWYCWEASWAAVRLRAALGATG